MTTKKKAVKKKATVYIGPSLEGLPQYSVFIEGELPAYVAQKVKANENVAGLFVPLDELAQARQDILKPGHLLNYYLKQLMQGSEK